MMRLPGTRTQRVAYLLFVGVFLIYLFNAESVNHAISGKSYIVRVPHDLPLHAKGNLTFGFSAVNINNKFEEGQWFVCDGKPLRLASNHGEARARVFFRSADALFELLENRHSFWSARSMKTLLSSKVPTCGLENGIYQMGLYLCNDSGERFVWTDHWFERIPGGPVEYIGRPVDPIPAMASGDVAFEIEDIYKDAGGPIVVRGWAVLENAEMDDYNAYITVKGPSGVSKWFYAPLYTRMDIASIYDDSRAANCGFRIKILKTELTSGSNAIRVVLKSRRTGKAVESLQTETKTL